MRCADQVVVNHKALKRASPAAVLRLVRRGASPPVRYRTSSRMMISVAAWKVPNTQAKRRSRSLVGGVAMSAMREPDSKAEDTDDVSGRARVERRQHPG